MTAKRYRWLLPVVLMIPALGRAGWASQPPLDRLQLLAA